MSFIWGTALVLVVILALTAQLTQKKMVSDDEKWNQFECGFNLMNPPHLPFSFQFFLVALLFLIFDVEIALILSYPMEMSLTKNSVVMFMFLLALSLGLIYEWQKSKINWSNWMGDFLCKKMMLDAPTFNVAYPNAVSLSLSEVH